VGFGHTLLRDSLDSKGEHQPRTLDGQVWITADARIDGRAELISALRATGRQLETEATAAELILHAYGAFGDAFLQHLIGDFAFALWDSRTATLLCARDHFGVRPFFYAKTGSAFVFGTDLDALLEHPSIATRLDEEAIGDFLLFGACQNSESSIYRDIKRLPAASRLCVTQEALSISRYWGLPQRDEIRYTDYIEYVDQFRDIFSKAVNERAETLRVAIELSGGMDSSSIAATLATDKQTAARTVTAYTINNEGLVPDDREAYYASIVASHLGIPIVEQASRNYALFERFDQPALVTAEPAAYSLLAAQHDTFSQIVASGTRVLLTGQGGDAVFGGASPSPRGYWRPAYALQRLVEIYGHIRHTGTLRGLGLRSALMTALGRSEWHPDFPDWIDADFAKRTHLHDRWQTGWKIIDDAVGSHCQLAVPWLSSVFENYETLKMPLVVRYPFFDVRLVDFLIHTPNYINSGKKIVRDAMRGKLPEAVRARPKTYLSGDHVRARFRLGKIAIPMESRLTLVRNDYVDFERYTQAFSGYLGGDGSNSTWTSYYMLSPIALNLWLTQRASRKTQGATYED
jgi:asparagine synthase (glutamine-hydrolysing)